MSDKSIPECDCCNSNGFVKKQITCPEILGPTSSKMDNFEYRAGFNLDKAKKESSAAKMEAAKKGISSSYNDIDDISSGQNFNPEKW
jgi:hypothetical protein